jgi:glutamine synthetase
MSASARFLAISAATGRSPRKFEKQVDGQTVCRVPDYYGVNTFTLAKLGEKIPRSVVDQLTDAVGRGKKLDPSIAEPVAQAVKEWAAGRGATHFCHWFQPMTGSTAEKHDAFLDFDRTGRPIDKFTGAMLTQSEPDASSFPSGGMRTTFEARGYTAWDPTTPMFLMETENGKTLCIPSVFVSYTGHVLDKKSQVLRSQEALTKQATELLAHLGEDVDYVVPTLGCEQEYFLLDRAYYALRPDIALANRTLVGAEPPKGQSLDDHYFGAIPARAQAFMQEVEFELYKLGVPAKTRHNEVAPSQFELAQIFTDASVAVDHNHLIMEILRKVAARHDFRCLLHEKPFARINGSGKHANWSIRTADNENLLEPGKTPQNNLRFLTVLSAVLLGVHRYAGLLRASVAHHGNDFRLGANEAPPAIISVFLGTMLTRIVDAVCEGTTFAGDPEEAMIELGVSNLPSVKRDNTDRNRTSPFAFTGNKFEFRAVGANQTPAIPVCTLNVAAAEGMRQLNEWIAESGGGKEAVLSAIRLALIESKPTRFEGNNYAQEWVEEAERRGLKNLRTAPEALDELRDDANIALFVKHGVLSSDEVAARYNVRVEQYVTTVQIEVDLLKGMVDTQILPIAMEERVVLATAISSLMDLEARGLRVDASLERTRFDTLTELTKDLQDARLAMTAAMGRVHGASNEAKVCAKHVVPAIEKVREAVDGLESLVSDSRWPLPKYHEMLFLV